MQKELTLSLGIIIAVYAVTGAIEYHTNHNHDQLMYLRKISDQLSRLEERFDDTPSHCVEYKRIKERADESEFLISCYLEQLRLFRTGKIRIGLIALLMPRFFPELFLNAEEQVFDRCNELLKSYYDQQHYYTAEMNSLFEKTLAERSSKATEVILRRKIAENISVIIEEAVAQEVIARNDYEIPEDIYYQVRKYYNYDSTISGDLKEKLLDNILTNIDCFNLYDTKKMIIAMFMPKPSDGRYEILKY